jgi:hypothetical protein
VPDFDPADPVMTDPVVTDQDVLRRVDRLMDQDARRQRSVWLLFLAGDGVQLPVVVPIDDVPERPDPQLVGNLCHVIAHVLADAAPEGSAVVTLARPGSETVDDTDCAACTSTTRTVHPVGRRTSSPRPSFSATGCLFPGSRYVRGSRRIKRALETPGKLWVRVDLGRGLPLSESPREREEQAGVCAGEQVVEQFADAFEPSFRRKPSQPGEFLGEDLLRQRVVRPGDDRQRSGGQAEPLRHSPKPLRTHQDEVLRVPAFEDDIRVVQGREDAGLLVDQRGEGKRSSRHSASLPENFEISSASTLHSPNPGDRSLRDIGYGRPRVDHGTSGPRVPQLLVGALGVVAVRAGRHARLA